VFAVQAAVVAAAVMLLGGAVSTVAGRKAGIVAGILGAVLPGMVIMHLNLSPVPFIFLCTAALMATAASRRPSAVKAALSGLFVGIGVIFAPAFAYIVPGALAVQRRWRLFLLVLIGTLLPYTAFNVIQHNRLEPVYAPWLYEVEVSKMIRDKTAWDGAGHVYDNAAIVLSKQWSVERGNGIDSSTQMSSFAVGYGIVAILYLGLIGFARCWRSELRSVFLPPLLYMLLIVVLSKVDYHNRVVLSPVLIAFTAMLLSGSCGGKGK
jgi:MFS family permease